MIVTTTPAIEGRKIIEYKGIVFGEMISGVDYEVLGQAGNMLMVTASGTAVVVE
jgi:uncharacterized protein YbjQ (UPF0145 family)